MAPDWYLTKDGDKSCLELYRRHYSAKKAYRDGRERFQFVGPGFSIVLRTARADAVFVWRVPSWSMIKAKEKRASRFSAQ